VKLSPSFNAIGLRISEVLRTQTRKALVRTSRTSWAAKTMNSMLTGSGWCWLIGSGPTLWLVVLKDFFFSPGLRNILKTIFWSIFL